MNKNEHKDSEKLRDYIDKCTAMRVCTHLCKSYLEMGSLFAQSFIHSQALIVQDGPLASLFGVS
jgi:hypothetical protein